MASETELERLVVRLTGDASSYIGMLRQAQSQTQQTGQSISLALAPLTGMGSTLAGMGRPLLQLAGIAGVVGTAWKSVSMAAEAEKTEVAFGTMLKSAQLGKQMTKDLQDFAAATPLNLPDIQRAAKLLLQFGTAGGDVIPTLQKLGDVTGGDADRFQHMAYAFGQMSASGRLMGQDLMQMINAGFNPLQEIARTTGKSVSQLKAEMEKGAISVDMVKNAFKTATSQGGQFFQLMQLQSQTTSGLFSTMLDDIGGVLRTLGSFIVEAFKLKDVMKGVSNAAQSVSQWFKDNSAVLEQLKSTIGVAFEVGKAAVEVFWDAMKMAWGWVQSQTGLAFTSAADFIVEALIRAEFAIRNLDKLIGFTWATIKVGAAIAADFITDSFYGLLASVSGVWFAIVGGAEAAWENLKAGFSATGDFMMVVLRALSAALRAAFSLKDPIEAFKKDLAIGLEGLANTARQGQDIGQAMGDGFSMGFEWALSQFNVGESDFTKQAKQDLQALGGELGADFAAFRDERLKALLPKGKDEKQAYAAGEKMGKGLTKGVKREIEKFDTALFGSAEAFQRIEAFQALVRGDKGKAASPAVASALASPEGKGKEEEHLKSIKQGVSALVQQGKGQLNVVPAGVG